jgi:hypothetical protein
MEYYNTVSAFLMSKEMKSLCGLFFEV